MPPSPTVRAVSDLHVGYRDNQVVLERIRPMVTGDWLIVAGDVADTVAEVEDALSMLAGRFERVIWAPGNHELWTVDRDAVQLRGVSRYEHLVQCCRSIGVLTPEDPYPVWTGSGGPVRIAPMFLLYDYSFLAPGTATAEDSLACAYEAGIVCTDEVVLHPDPFPTRAAWCAERVTRTERRLLEVAGDVPLLLVNHWPLLRAPTAVMTHPEFAQWCGTTATADWHTRFDVAAVVYGHLHIPRTTVHDGVRFEEVSIGYPAEWLASGLRPDLARQVFPAPATVPDLG